jgi:hypothetical protein
MDELLVRIIQVICVFLLVGGGALCFLGRRWSSALLHMFDESAPLQSRSAEDRLLATRSHEPASRLDPQGEESIGAAQR